MKGSFTDGSFSKRPSAFHRYGEKSECCVDIHGAQRLSKIVNKIGPLYIVKVSYFFTAFEPYEGRKNYLSGIFIAFLPQLISKGI